MDEILASIRRIIESGDDHRGAHGIRSVQDPDPRPSNGSNLDDEAASEAIARLVAGAATDSTHSAAPDTELVGPSQLQGANDPGTRPHAEEQEQLAGGDGVLPAVADDLAILWSHDGYEDLARALEDELSVDDATTWTDSDSRQTADIGDSGDEPEHDRPTEVQSAVVSQQSRTRTYTFDDRSLPALNASYRLQPDDFGTPVMPSGIKAAAVRRDMEPATLVPTLDEPQGTPPMSADDVGTGPLRSDADDPEVGTGVPADRPHLLSDRTGELVGASFGELTQAIREGELRSLETMAEEMLRPMLQEWLDDNLPKLVERLVREEIERVARGGKR